MELFFRRKLPVCIYCINSIEGGGGMHGVMFFMVVFCGIFGAAELLRLLYRAVVRRLGEKNGRKGG